MTYATIDRPTVGESNGLVNGIEYHNTRNNQEDGVSSVDWDTKSHSTCTLGTRELKQRSSGGAVGCFGFHYLLQTKKI